jgi:hypothetical protein
MQKIRKILLVYEWKISRDDLLCFPHPIPFDQLLCSQLHTYILDPIEQKEEIAHGIIDYWSYCIDHLSEYPYAQSHVLFILLIPSCQVRGIQTLLNEEGFTSKE